jgi:hypothetical protein
MGHSPQRRDLQGEYFTRETELGLDWYDRRPVLYHHGLDGNLKAAIIGVIDTLRLDEIGVWAEAQLDMRQRYVRAVHRLIERGILGWSSGSLTASGRGDGRWLYQTLAHRRRQPHPRARRATTHRCARHQKRI